MSGQAEEEGNAKQCGRAQESDEAQAGVSFVASGARRISRGRRNGRQTPAMRIALLKVGLLPSGPRPSSEATEGSDLTQAFRFEIFEGFLLAIQECLTAGARRCGKSTRNVI